MNRQEVTTFLHAAIVALGIIALVYGVSVLWR
jgi:hypothetical protein